jgi:hypothetical protein
MTRLSTRSNIRSVFVGDVVMLKDPENSEKELVRRVAALEGDEMLSSKEDEASFKLKPGTCWVLCDNESLSPKVLVRYQIYSNSAFYLDVINGLVIHRICCGFYIDYDFSMLSA